MKSNSDKLFRMIFGKNFKEVKEQTLVEDMVLVFDREEIITMVTRRI